MTNVILSTTALVAGYVPQVDILRGVSITVTRNEIVTVVGSNGAGKSTLLKTMVGLLAPKNGNIILGSLDVVGLPPSAIVGHGLGYVPQRENVFETLSVEENLEVGLRPRRDLPSLQRKDAMYALFPRLRECRRQFAGNLSGGERQMLAVARALMPEPKVLLLDEPTAGLAPRSVDLMFEQVLAINRAGTTVLMVEQNATRALAMSHRGYVLALGRNAYEGSGPALARDPKVAEIFLGGLSA